MPKNWEPVDFTIYFAFIRWVVLSALVLEIILRFWLDKSGNLEIISWAIRLIAFIFLGWRSFAKFGRSLAVGAIAGISSGAAIGLVIALFRFLDGIKIWKFFNLLTETTLTALVGGAVAALAVYLLSFKKRII